jgi:polyhydroxybutyrate depolymerase
MFRGVPVVLPRLFVLASCAAVLAAAGALAEEPSSGCGAPPPQWPPEVFQVDGRERPAIVVLPEEYRADLPHALIFAFHGRTSPNAQARRYFGLEDAADRPAIYVYPAALRDQTGRFTWADPGDRPDALRDFALFDQMFEQITAAYCIDLDAVYAVGHSLGASFANSLACARADRVRAVASFAGGIMPSECSGEVAGLLLHNPRDQAVPVSEGERARDVLLGGEVAPDTPLRRSIGPFECQLYHDREYPLFWCLHGQDVTAPGRFYPHQWPEGAAEGIFEFFDMLAG